MELGEGALVDDRRIKGGGDDLGVVDGFPEGSGNTLLVGGIY